MSKPAPAQYRSTNWNDYNIALKAEVPSPPSWHRLRVGGSPSYRFCSELDRFGRLKLPVSDYSTVYRRQKTLIVSFSVSPPPW